jgi:DNA polymerase III epsilon subunit-like protein
VSWKESFIYVDTETTGLLANARVVEMAFAWFEKRVLTRSFTTLVNPGPDFDLTAPDCKAAFEVNGIDPASLASAPTFDQVLRGFFSKLGTEPWAAHNMAFDLRMLGIEKKHLERITGQNWNAFVPKPQGKLDTMLLAYHLYPGINSYKLSSVAEHLGVEWPSTHRALDDCRCGGQALVKMADALPDSLQEVMAIQKIAQEKWDACPRKSQAQGA